MAYPMSPSIYDAEKAVVALGLLNIDSPCMDNYSCAFPSSSTVLPWTPSAYPNWSDKHEDAGQISSVLTATNEDPNGAEQKRSSRRVRFQFNTYQYVYRGALLLHSSGLIDLNQPVNSLPSWLPAILSVWPLPPLGIGHIRGKIPVLSSWEIS